MSLPMTIEGQKYFVTLPALSDFRNFKEFLEADLRRKAYAAIPPGLSEAELSRWMGSVESQCDQIDPFAALSELVKTPDGTAMLFYSLLRIENPGVTLTWCRELIDRAEQNKPAAIEGLRELRMAMTELLRSKKNERDQAAEQPEATSQLSSTQSISA